MFWSNIPQCFWFINNSGVVCGDWCYHAKLPNPHTKLLYLYSNVEEKGNRTFDPVAHNIGTCVEDMCRVLVPRVTRVTLKLLERLLGTSTLTEEVVVST